MITDFDMLIFHVKSNNVIHSSDPVSSFSYDERELLLIIGPSVV